MFRYFILILAGLVYVAPLSSCSKPVTTTQGETTQHNVFLKNMGNGACRQLQDGLMWQIKKSEKISSWEEAVAYADKLQLAGFDDWRLPTRDECLMLSELLLMDKGDCPIKIRKAHWVSDNNRHKAGFWDEYPLCGGAEFRWVKSKNGAVRAVRP